MCSGKGSLTTISGSSECFSSVIPRSLLRGASFEKAFGNGMSGQALTVPRFGSEVLTAEVITGIGSFLRQMQGVSSGITKVRYRLKGKAFAQAPSSFTIPFDESGEVDLNLAPTAEK